MVQTLDIGTFVFNRLNSSADLEQYLGAKGNIYPVVADNKVQGTFIVYRRVALASESTKDMYKQDKVQVEIVIVSKKYTEGLQAATEVRSLMEFQHATYNNLDINDCHIVQAQESYENEMFVQRMTFAMTIE
jgi:hypothetical protein